MSVINKSRARKINLFVDIILVDICDEVDAHDVLFDKTSGGGRRGEDVGPRRRIPARRS